MQNFESIYRLIYQYPLIALLAGAVIWFLGWKIYKIFIYIAGIFIGASLALRFSHMVQLPDLALMIMGGIIGGLLAFFALYVMFFFLGVSIGYDVVLRSAGQHAEILGLLVGIALGLAFIVLLKVFVVIATSYVGSLMMVHSIIVLTGIELSNLLAEVTVIIVTIIGVAMQYKVWGRPDIENPRLKRS
jgi:hypothetical protein